jgi:light-harvesting complex 1 beta chain
MSNTDEKMGVGTYLTPQEAQEFHKLFVASFIGFTIVAILAHFLVWSWRPWIPGPDGYAAASSASRVAATAPATTPSA